MKEEQYQALTSKPFNFQLHLDNVVKQDGVITSAELKSISLVTDEDDEPQYDEYGIYIPTPEELWDGPSAEDYYDVCRCD